MTNQIVLRDQDNMTLAELGSVLVKSRFFADSTDVNQAIVKVLAGRELGFGPIASMNGIHIIKGKPAAGANLMASAVKSNPKYDYRVVEMTDTVCRIKFFEGKDEIGVSTFTIEDARKAGTQNTDRFPRNMLFARAMSNGVRWFCPDVFNGNTLYTPEELGAAVDGEGEIIDAKVNYERPDTEFAQAPLDPEQPTTVVWDDSLPVMSLEAAGDVLNSKGERYGDLPAEKLAFMANSLRKLQREGRATEEHLLKLSAIQTILATVS